MRKRVLYFALTMMLTGCVARSHEPDPLQVQLASYGTLPDTYKTDVKNTFYYHLKDPYSAHYRFFKPFKGYTWVMNVPEDKEELMFGWVIPGVINTKNSFGAYVGARRFVVIYSNGQYQNIYYTKGTKKIGRVP
ncbi:hypothetical protein [Pantoea sp. PNA 03-3]|uniref:hypothetical protein n=1 Tax=Pantoea sp. PNA 03-3 TaxID=2135460 RepID=UPI000D76DB26|nr:hypothetical protein [Pantoea sp. PNA 03-3]PXV75752.1 hypothetical protein C7433_103505 [Pantoea sp. PNA 03-3]